MDTIYLSDSSVHDGHVDLRFAKTNQHETPAWLGGEYSEPNCAQDTIIKTINYDDMQQPQPDNK